MSFRKLLVANRGEIACRVMRTARRLGYPTVAVFSDADTAAPHVRMADEAVRIGAAPAAASYLDIAALLAAAHATGADALHPGYGFLSERAELAQACAAAGITFIGPPPEAIRAMGSKAEAKRRMRAAGVPCAPGYDGTAQDDATLGTEAARLGYPLLVKAVAGGGGRGMRLVRAAAELPEALAGARREALSAFGDGTLMLERLVERGRHIEVQVFADSHGGCIHLGERDCSAQRRRQKVIEEAPSPFATPALREALGRDAVAAARAVGYVGAGTVEFIVDEERRHWFLEMNTRLQVEHPVTEAITGLDLVEWQLRVARGEPLPLAQDAVRFAGHAIEARLYAEDPAAGWLPQTGPILHWRPEQAPHGVRIDHGIAEGGEVGPHYDAMVAKFVAHGTSREDAVRRLVHALRGTPLLGPAHNGEFLAGLLEHPAFAAGAVHTTLLDEWLAAPAAERAAPLQPPPPPETAWLLAAALIAPPAERPSSVAQFTLTLECGAHRRTLLAPPSGLRLLERHGPAVRFECQGVLRQATVVAIGGTLHVHLQGRSFRFGEASPWPDGSASTDGSRLCSPVAGVVAKILAAAGARVQAGQPLVCVEAMKMEMWQQAPAAGRVRALHVAAGMTVAAGALLLELEPDEAPTPEPAP